MTISYEHTWSNGSAFALSVALAARNLGANSSLLRMLKRIGTAKTTSATGTPCMSSLTLRRERDLYTRSVGLVVSRGFGTHVLVSLWWVSAAFHRRDPEMEATIRAAALARGPSD